MICCSDVLTHSSTTLLLLSITCNVAPSNSASPVTAFLEITTSVGLFSMLYVSKTGLSAVITTSRFSALTRNDVGMYVSTNVYLPNGIPRSVAWPFAFKCITPILFPRISLATSPLAVNTEPSSGLMMSSFAIKENSICVIVFSSTKVVS